MNWLQPRVLQGIAKERLTAYIASRSIHVAPTLGVTSTLFKPNCNNWHKPCFVLSGNTDKAKMAGKQKGKECVNERMRQREKGTEYYTVEKKWTWKSRCCKLVPHGCDITWSYLNMYRFLMNYTPPILAQNRGGKKRTAGPKWWIL